MGAEVMVVGANWPAPRALHRSALLVARAIENQAFVIGVNRAGKDPHLTYAGASMAVNAKGEVVVQCGEGELVAKVDVDIAAVRAWRETFPAWRDRRLG
jgi:predicted amidohydrolase